MATRPMQYGGGHRQRLNLEGGGAKNNNADRFNDMASYVTDTSSITNPIELGGISSSDENDDDGFNDDAVSFIDSATSALTGLTGWTSAYGGGGHKEGMDTISEMGESEAFQPMAHSKSYKSASEDSLSFDMDGSVETSLGEIEVLHTASYKSRGSRKGKVNYGGGGDARPPLMPRSQGNNNNNSKAVQFRSEGKKAPSSPTASVNSNGSKKRDPVPPMRDPNMDDTEEDQMWEEDCNYDINPTVMFLILESHDWKEAIALLDGKSGVAGQNKSDEAWNLGSLFGAKKLEDDKKKAEITKKQQDALKQQARTWIVRRERNGILRWRMLPLHAALAFNAPFDVVLRLYHLYPGAVRCRNDQGMVPLHHCFKFGNEDKVLELLLDVFPEALTVVDDKGHTPIACTPKDGGDNERRSNIMTLFCNFQVEMAKKQMGVDIDDNSVATEPDVKETAAAKKIVEPVLTTTRPTSGAGEGTLLGATPRYTFNTDYNAVTYNSIKPPTAKSPKKKNTKVPQAPAKETPLSPKDEDISDRYAMGDDSENNPVFGNALGGLSTISEDEDPEQDDSLAKKALKSELLMLREIKKKKGIRKMFARKKAYV